MAIDIEKMMERLNKNKHKGGGNKADPRLFKPRAEKGETKNYTIRFVSTPDNDPFKDLHFHYTNRVPGGGKAVLCLKKNFGKRCPMCEFASSLWQTEDPKNQEMAKSLFVRERYYAPVIVREEEKDEASGELIPPRWHDFPPSAYEKFFGMITNPRIGDITDPKKGFDFQLTYKMPSKQGAYPSRDYERLDSGPLHEDAKTVKWYLDNVPSLSECFPVDSEKEIVQLINEMVNAQNSSMSDSEAEAASDEEKLNGNSVEDLVKQLNA